MCLYIIATTNQQNFVLHSFPSRLTISRSLHVMNRKTVAPLWYISIIAKKCVISRYSHPAPEGYRSNAKHFGFNWS